MRSERPHERKDLINSIPSKKKKVHTRVGYSLTSEIFFENVAF
jgi:hypothetical protein